MEDSCMMSFIKWGKFKDAKDVSMYETFKAGWTARDAEIESLKEKLEVITAECHWLNSGHIKKKEE
jgi:hypothetical protein